jgi:hypothetical protein
MFFLFFFIFETSSDCGVLHQVSIEWYNLSKSCKIWFIFSAFSDVLRSFSLEKKPGIFHIVVPGLIHISRTCSKGAITLIVEKQVNWWHQHESWYMSRLDCGQIWILIRLSCCVSKYVRIPLRIEQKNLVSLKNENV